MLAQAESERGNLTEARTHLEAGLAAVADQAPSREVAELYEARVSTLARLGDVAGAEATAQDWLALAQRWSTPRAVDALVAECTLALVRREYAAARRQAIVSGRGRRACRGPRAGV